jgi:hypothetical protein
MCSEHLTCVFRTIKERCCRDQLNSQVIKHNLAQIQQTNAAHLFLQVGEEYKLWFGISIEIIDLRRGNARTRASASKRSAI